MFLKVKKDKLGIYAITEGNIFISFLKVMCIR